MKTRRESLGASALAFIEDQKDITLLFRGSSNQRILDLKRRA